MTLPDWASDYAPIVRFHPNEQNFPCSIEWLLAGPDTVLAGLAGPPIKNPTVADLVANASVEGAYVQLDPTYILGNQPLADAPLYVVAATPPDEPAMIDLTFFVLFAFNGPQGARVSPVVAGSFACLLPAYGKHQGDIESVTVRVNPPQQGGGGDVVWVRYGAHGDDTFLAGPALPLSGTHPLVNCGLGSHAMYPPLAGEDFHTSDDYTWCGAGFDLGDWVSVPSDDGVVWSQQSLVEVGLNPDRTPADGTAPWATFGGRLGGTQHNVYQGAVNLGNAALPGDQLFLVNTLQGLASQLGLIPVDETIGRGPVGLRDRPSAQVAPATSPWIVQLNHIGGNTTALTPVVVDDTIYFVGTDGGINSVGTTGNGWRRLAPAGSTYSHLSVDDRYVYYTRSPEDGLGLMRMGRDGSDPTLLTPPTCLAYCDPFACEGWVYFVEAVTQDLYRVDADGHNLASIGSQQSLGGPQVLDDAVYFRGLDSSLVRCRPDGSAGRVLATTNAPPCVAGDGYVYYMGTDGGLSRVPQDGSSGGVRIGHDSTRTTPAVADGRVYWQGLQNDLCWALVDGSSQGIVNGNRCADTPFPYGGTVYFCGLDEGLDSCSVAVSSPRERMSSLR